MVRCVGAAAMLLESDRKDLAVQALARSTTISDLSIRHGVSRKFIYRQARKADEALDEIFLSGTAEDVLFQLTVSKIWPEFAVCGHTEAKWLIYGLLLPRQFLA